LISFIKGIVFLCEEDNIIIDVGGIGYQIYIPYHVFETKPSIGDEILLYTHLQIRDDSWQLYGFPLKEQLDIFRFLITVSGVGPKLGIVILNHLSVEKIIQAVFAGDNNELGTVPGIGKKIAQRLVLELKEKFKKLNLSNKDTLSEKPQVGNGKDEAVLALAELGYSLNDAKAAVTKASLALSDDIDIQELIKGSLKLLSKL
jgi:Holliday junction DNA helicase RuvA